MIDLTPGQPRSILGKLLDQAASNGFRRMSNYTGLDRAPLTESGRRNVGASVKRRWKQAKAENKDWI